MKSQKNAQKNNSLADFFFVMLATCFFLSYVPAKLAGLVKKTVGGQTLSEKKWTGAGFIGSVFGVFTFLLLPAELANSILVILIAIVISIVVSHQAEKALKSHDDSRIVIDEWAGVWVALWGHLGQGDLAILLAFFLFRFFDVWKGPLLNWMQRLPGGLGVTMDDVGAGILANLGTWMAIKWLPVNLS